MTFVYSYMSSLYEIKKHMKNVPYKGTILSCCQKWLPAWYWYCTLSSYAPVINEMHALQCTIIIIFCQSFIAITNTFNVGTKCFIAANLQWCWHQQALAPSDNRPAYWAVILSARRRQWPLSIPSFCLLMQGGHSTVLSTAIASSAAHGTGASGEQEWDSVICSNCDVCYEEHCWVSHLSCGTLASVKECCAALFLSSCLMTVWLTFWMTQALLPKVHMICLQSCWRLKRMV